MKISGLSSIDHAPQVVAEWLNLLQMDLGWSDRGRAYLVLRGTLHALRDFLSVDEAADLAAQLPLLIRGLYFEGWVPSRTPAHPRSTTAFLNLAMKPLGNDPTIDAGLAVAAVLALLRRQISPGEFDQISHALRKSTRELWM